MGQFRWRGTDLSEQERRDWAAYTASASVRPLPGRPRPAQPSVAPPPPPSPRPATPSVRHRAVLPPLAIGEPPPGLDAARWSRLRAGRLVPERRLDLHGLTAAQAHVALRAFLFAAAEAEVRCVAVITGRGSGEAGGVLKRELPLWLNDATLRPLLLAAAYACAANPGAVLLLLRRRR